MKDTSLEGKRFGKLLVIEKSDNKGKNTAWLCKCDCGKEKNILTYNLTTGKSKSCGCVRGIKLGDLSRTHSGSGTRLYAIYKGIKQRCYNKNNPAFSWYGGKGIRMNTLWRESFNAFREWSINNGYNDNLSIDRINPEGGYEPINCRWTTIKQQQNNKGNSFFIKINGERLTVAEWAEKTKTKKQSLYDKIYRLLDQLGIENKSVINIEINT